MSDKLPDKETKEWIERNGSGLLKKYVQEGVEYYYKYLEERLAEELPGWTLINCVCELRDGQPTEQDFILLDEARRTLRKTKLGFVRHTYSRGQILPVSTFLGKNIAYRGPGNYSIADAFFGIFGMKRGK